MVSSFVAVDGLRVSRQRVIEISVSSLLHNAQQGNMVPGSASRMRRPVDSRDAEEDRTKHNRD
jgi:hypothetical protein